jgi:hypothetical protein
VEITGHALFYHIADYKQPPFWVDTVDLNFILNEDATLVHSKLELRWIARQYGRLVCVL